MDPARWERVQALFHRAADLDEAGRPQFLEQACGGDRALQTELQRMLEQDTRASLLDRDVTEVASDMFAGAISSSLRESSPYRIQRMLGEGGMGVVYLAERTDLGNLVAIKILRDGWLSPERRGRFMAEQRMLAQLNHPSIARLYDASTLPDGTPWFVMEYVDGVPLNEYCRANHCTVDQRVKLIRAVAEAVQYAHERGVVHRDLKPSNILVKPDGSLRLLDFGIAKQLNPEAAATKTRTEYRPMTPAYASPEQLRGQPVGISSDVYSLGVVLYELLAAKLPFDLKNRTASEAEALIASAEPAKPSAVARQAGLKPVDTRLDTLCLVAMAKDPARRYPSVAAFLRDIDHYLNGQPLDVRGPRQWPLAGFARRNVHAVFTSLAALVLLIVALTLALSRRPAYSPVHSRAIAVIPFQNVGADQDLDYLCLTLPDEIWRTLSNARSLSLRLPETTRKYTGAARDPQKAGRELHVNTIASGRFFRAGDQLQITLELTDVETNRMVWSDVFDVPAGNLVAMQAQVAAKTRRAMAPVLGAAEFVTENAPKPSNEEAYQLYLRAAVIPDDLSTHPEMNARKIDMLRKSVALDPAYAPAWQSLEASYEFRAWWGDGGEEAMARARECIRRATALDPDNIVWQAGLLYQRSSAEYAHKAGAISKAEAYRGLQDLLRRRPDIARLHFLISWILRDTGDLDEAARECEASVLIDAQDAGARSCGVVYLVRGDYARAADYLRLDPDSEVSKAMSIDILLRQEKPDEALRAMQRYLPQWAGYSVVQAYLRHRPPQEIAALARDLKPAVDPEVNYFSAAHLAYVQQPDAALEMLKQTIDGGYCSFPAAESDPMFTNVRAARRYAAIERSGMACLDQFLKERGSPR